jgi:hypothetical protein
MSSWFNGVELSFSTAQDSRGPISNIVNVKFIIEPLIFPGFVIAPNSLLRIKQ